MKIKFWENVYNNLSLKKHESNKCRLLLPASNNKNLHFEIWRWAQEIGRRKSICRQSLTTRPTWRWRGKRQRGRLEAAGMRMRQSLVLIPGDESLVKRSFVILASLFLQRLFWTCHQIRYVHLFWKTGVSYVRQAGWGRLGVVRRLKETTLLFSF